MKRLRSTSAGRWWLVWVSGGRKWVLGSSKAVNVACLGVYDPRQQRSISASRNLQNNAFGGIWSGAHDLPGPATIIRHRRCLLMVVVSLNLISLVAAVPGAASPPSCLTGVMVLHNHSQVSGGVHSPTSPWPTRPTGRLCGAAPPLGAATPRASRGASTSR